MAELSITITIPDQQLPRMLAAFARRYRTPSLTREQMLDGLKQSAIAQIANVVRAEEIAAIEEQKATILPLDLA